MPEGVDDHPWLVCLGRAGEVVADMAVDIAAIGAIYLIAAVGVPETVFQLATAAVTSIALGKRYMQHRHDRPRPTR